MKKIAVIGAGPAGCSAAYHLRADGMDVDIFNDFGKSIKNKKGELVCKNVFPTIPLKFWKDKNNIKIGLFAKSRRVIKKVSMNR